MEGDDFGAEKIVSGGNVWDGDGVLSLVGNEGVDSPFLGGSVVT